MLHRHTKTLGGTLGDAREKNFHAVSSTCTYTTDTLFQHGIDRGQGEQTKFPRKRNEGHRPGGGGLPFAARAGVFLYVSVLSTFTAPRFRPADVCPPPNDRRLRARPPWPGRPASRSASRTLKWPRRAHTRSAFRSCTRASATQVTSNPAPVAHSRSVAEPTQRQMPTRSPERTPRAPSPSSWGTRVRGSSSRSARASPT